MLSIQITNQKDFTTRLFVREDFDNLLLDSATIRVYADYTIDGRINPAYFEGDDILPTTSFLPWEKYRPVCFQMIKGSKKPSYFKFVFRMNEAQCQQFEEFAKVPLSSLMISGLFLNIRYDNGTLLLTTGVAQKSFTMDRTAETTFDQFVVQFLKDKNIDFDIC